MINDRLTVSTMVHEGARKDAQGRHKAYQDSRGIWTIGYGTNAQELRVDEATALRWLNEKLTDAEGWALKYPWYVTMDQARQNVIVEMIYNLGPERFAGFHRLHDACARGLWAAAGHEMLDSDWATQVGVRAQHLERQMVTGVYWDVR